MTRFFILILAFISCNTNNDTKMKPNILKPVENIEATKDQQERRTQSEAYCKAHDIHVYANPNALFVEAEDKINLRTKDEVVDRAIALLYIGLKSEGLEQSHLDKLDKDFNITPKFSAKEKAYATAAHPTEQQTTDANWRYEGLHVMLRALGFIDSLAYPDQLCVVAHDVKIVHDLGEQQFRQKAKLRTKKEILDQADLILRLDWACVNARIKGQPAPGNMDKSVVYERHYALHWLIHFLNQDWDNVSTDT